MFPQTTNKVFHPIPAPCTKTPSDASFQYRHISTTPSHLQNIKKSPIETSHHYTRQPRKIITSITPPQCPDQTLKVDILNSFNTGPTPTLTSPLNILTTEIFEEEVLPCCMFQLYTRKRQNKENFLESTIPLQWAILAKHTHEQLFVDICSWYLFFASESNDKKNIAESLILFCENLSRSSYTESVTKNDQLTYSIHWVIKKNRSHIIGFLKSKDEDFLGNETRALIKSLQSKITSIKSNNPSILDT